MFIINDDKSIYITRGDAARFAVTAERDGTAYTFQPLDVVRFKVFEKKGCDCVVLQKDFIVSEAAESVEIDLTRLDTKIGDIIHKPKDLWYEVELNPETEPQTIIGYDEDGAKIFRLLPEGKDELGGEEDVDHQRHVYEQMQQLVEESKDIAQSVRDDADNGVFDYVLTPEDKKEIAEDVKTECADDDILKYVATNGIVAGDNPGALLTTPGNGLQTVTAPGEIIIDGITRKYAAHRRTWNVSDTERKEVFLYRLDRVSGEIEFLWRSVTMYGDTMISPADSAELPIRSDSVYDVLNCMVTIPANAETITADMIHDLREYAETRLSGGGNGGGGVDVAELTAAVETALADAKESGVFDGADGKDGKDGTSVTVTNVTTSTADGGNNVVTFSDGKTLTVKNGSKGSTGATGAAGANGKDGTSVTVTNVTTSTADGGNNVVTFSDGKTLTVKNGSKGSTGATGAKGDKGDPGTDATVTATNIKNALGFTPANASDVAEIPRKVTPQMYGAKGDGTTDDTVAFKQALSAERVVLVPGGTYKLTSGIVIGDNCMLELSQDTVMEFTNTTGYCINLGMSSNLKGNHATIKVPYAFEGAAIYAYSNDHTETQQNQVQPWSKWDPMWKTGRYVTDINICKADSRGFHYCVNPGECKGTAVYISADNTAGLSTYMWGVHYSGIRIAGAFAYGIHAKNIEDGWTNDTRIQDVLIDACEIGVLLEDCSNVYVSAIVQPRRAYTLDEVYKPYAKHGFKLVRSQNVDLTGSRVWDWQNEDKPSTTINEKTTLWTAGGEYQHIALIGDCRNLILDDFAYYQHGDTRKRIYTDFDSNLDFIKIIQEPITRWFRMKDAQPYFTDGTYDHLLITKERLDDHFVTDYIKSFTDVLPTAIDADGSVYNGIGYKANVATPDKGGEPVSNTYYLTTGFIPCRKGQKIYTNAISMRTGWDTGRIIMYDKDFNYIIHVNRGNLIKNTSYYAKYTETSIGCTITVENVGEFGKTLAEPAYIRLNIHKDDWGENPMISVDEDVKYTIEGFLNKSIKVYGESIVGLPGSAFDGFYYVEGTGTTAGKWTGTCDGITEYYDGLTVLYKLNVAGASKTTLNINNLGAVEVKRNATSSLGTIYPVGTVVMTTYSDGVWKIADYNVNTKNTAGTSPKDGTKMFLVGATLQTSDGTTTYTNSNVYIGDDNNLYSGGKKVANDEDVVKTINGQEPDENGNVEMQTDGGTSIDVTAEVGQTIIVKNVDENGKPTEYEAADFPVVDGAGEAFLLYTATFATDAAAQSGVRVADSMTNLLTWLDVNGELFKVHREQSGMSSIWCDEDGNKWVSSTIGGVYVNAQTAGTYTFTLYAPADTPMLDPQYIPPNLAKKADIPQSGGGTGGTSIDVTASVGQTIVVKEVDADGKPTKWESADYQPRTHWSEEGKVQVLIWSKYLSELNGEYGFYTIVLWFNEHVDSYPLTAIHSIEYDGVEYKNLATFELDGIRFFGNLYLLNDLFGTSFGDTGEPFVLTGNQYGMELFTLDQEKTEHSIQIYVDGTYRHRIEQCYVPKIPIVDLTPYYTEIESQNRLKITGDDHFEKVYEVLRKNEIVRIVYRLQTGNLAMGCGFPMRVQGASNIYVHCVGVQDGFINLNVDATRDYSYIEVVN